METTRINPERTVGEIQMLLAQHGAKAVLLEYEGRQVAAVSFQYIVNDREIPFRLPCRWQSIEQMLKDNGRRPRYDDSLESWARRVAWRQILRWVQAQLALVETRMVKIQEVFLPYVVTQNGQTIYELHEKKNFLLGSGK